MLKNNRKGFTLLELMIVVAIIGVLAAVAVPGFMAYIKSSKTAEAKTNLDSVKKGAIAFFEAEHYSKNGMTAVTKQYPGASGSLKYNRVGPFNLSEVGIKYRPEDYESEFKNGPWSLLNFRISGPFYYGYSYAVKTVVDGNGRILDDEVEGLAKKPNPASTFQVTACASINEKNDSSYVLTGSASGSVGAPVEANVAVGTCAIASVPK